MAGKPHKHDVIRWLGCLRWLGSHTYMMLSDGLEITYGAPRKHSYKNMNTVIGGF